MESVRHDLVLLVRLQGTYDRIAEAIRERQTPPPEVRELHEENRKRQAELSEMEARVASGRALEADALKIRQALERAELEQLALEQAHSVAAAGLARAVGSTAPVAAWPAPDWRSRPTPRLQDLAPAARVSTRHRVSETSVRIV